MRTSNVLNTQLFPVVYVSSDGKQLQSVNPLDSSLDSYQKKVEAAVEKFKRYVM
jgi:hypothetical protein